MKIIQIVISSGQRGCELIALTEEGSLYRLISHDEIGVLLWEPIPPIEAPHIVESTTAPAARAVNEE